MCWDYGGVSPLFPRYTPCGSVSARIIIVIISKLLWKCSSAKVGAKLVKVDARAATFLPKREDSRRKATYILHPSRSRQQKETKKVFFFRGKWLRRKEGTVFVVVNTPRGSIPLLLNRLSPLLFLGGNFLLFLFFAFSFCHGPKMSWGTAANTQEVFEELFTNVTIQLCSGISKFQTSYQMAQNPLALITILCD